MELKQSKVTFNEVEHEYYLDGQRLMGVTGLIHNVLGLGLYKDNNDFVKTIAVPRAGEYGSAVHKAIEGYELTGFELTIYPNTFYPAYSPYEYWDVSQELQSYKRNREGFSNLANEYMVSDNEKWASKIDNVWIRNDNGEIWLIDTKTNNLDYYPVSGYGNNNAFTDKGEALREYLSWQLSIYAYLFELQTGLKVKGIACNWLRKDKSAFWVISRKSNEDVKALLETLWSVNETGEVIYFHPEMEKLWHRGLTTTNGKDALTIAPDFIKAIINVQSQYDTAKEKLDEMKKALREAMESHGVKSWDCGAFKATIAADSMVKTFDTAKFKSDNPEIYKSYSVMKPKKGGFTIKMKQS